MNKQKMLLPLSIFIANSCFSVNSFSSGNSDPYSLGMGNSDPYSPDMGNSDPYSPGAGNSDPYSPGAGNSDPYSPGAGNSDPYSPDMGNSDPYSPGAGNSDPYAPNTTPANCISELPLGDYHQDFFEFECLSESRSNYDPYAPVQQAFAKYYRFTLNEDQDLDLSVYGNWSTRLELREGLSTSGTVIAQSYQQSLKTNLSSGTYTLEISDSSTGYFSFESQVYGDDWTCSTDIEEGQFTSDYWSQNCLSSNRMNDDPYSNGLEPHRSKLFTFSLEEDSDIGVNTFSSVSPYLYLMADHGESGQIIKQSWDRAFESFLQAGDYTLEVATRNVEDFGQFEVLLEKLNGYQACESILNLDSSHNDRWVPECKSQSLLTYQDPYSAEIGNAVRANYYQFSVTDVTDINFGITTETSQKIMNIYSGFDNFKDSSLIASSYDQNSSWAPYHSQLSISVQPGDYTLEVTHLGGNTPGHYQLRSESVINDVSCDRSIDIHSFTRFGESVETVVDDDCEPQLLLDSNLDPYSPSGGNNYKAKRFNFSVNEDGVSLRVDPNIEWSDHLVLAKKVGEEIYPITASKTDQWQWDHESIIRQLAQGDYVLEVLSQYSSQVTLDFSQAYNVCDRWLEIGVPEEANYYFSCRAEKKPTEYNSDPYSSEPNKYYYAKSYSFVIEEAGNYELSSNSDSFTPELYLMSGGERKVGGYRDNIISSGYRSISTWLDKGIYTVELTSLEANVRINSYSLLLEKK